MTTGELRVGATYTDDRGRGRSVRRKIVALAGRWRRGCLEVVPKSPDGTGRCVTRDLFPPPADLQAPAQRGEQAVAP